MTSCVTGVRYLGMLQAWELSTLDLLMRSRPPEKPDPRIAIVMVTEADLQSQTTDRTRRGSLSDRSLQQLLSQSNRRRTDRHWLGYLSRLSR